MTKKIDKIFLSGNGVKKTFQLASGYISQTTIHFENENIVAVIQAAGSVEFFDRDDTLIAAGSVSPDDSGRKVYEDVVCQVKDDVLILQFPIYEWIDNYPHCDGEHDRWDTRIIGFHALNLDLQTRELL